MARDGAGTDGRHQRGQLLHILSGHKESARGALLLDEGRQALSWSDDNTLRLRDLQRRKVMATYFSDASPSCVVPSETLRTVFAGDALGRVHLLRLNTGSAN
jgi:WD40 repeat protein